MKLFDKITLLGNRIFGKNKRIKLEEVDVSFSRIGRIYSDSILELKDSKANKVVMGILCLILIGGIYYGWSADTMIIVIIGLLLLLISTFFFVDSFRPIKTIMTISLDSIEIEGRLIKRKSILDMYYEYYTGDESETKALYVITERREIKISNIESFDFSLADITKAILYFRSPVTS